MPGNTFRRSAVNIKGLRLQVKLKNVNSPVLSVADFVGKAFLPPRLILWKAEVLESNRQTNAEESGKNEVD